MDFLTSRIKPMYFKYLTAAFGSALISSIYNVVDMAMAGQYQGPDGTAQFSDASGLRWRSLLPTSLSVSL